jgi:hypothetical protein
MEETFWRRCSNCKKEIPFAAKYSVCSVASCTKVRAPVQFCSPDCWAVHNEVENHKAAWAVEQIAPKAGVSSHAAATSAPTKPAQTSVSSVSPSSPPRPSVAPTPGSPSLPPTKPAQTSSQAAGDEVLVVVSRLKDFIKDASNGMSTSDQVVAPLSTHVRKMADAGIESANKNARKTMLGRDIPKPAPGGNNDDVLVIVSRLKEYVRVKADLRTSDEVPAVISEEIRRIARVAIEAARRDGRKTVMGRDIPS